MGTIKLNLESNAAQSLQETAEQLGNLNKAVDSFEKNGKDSMISVSKESEKLTANIKSTATESVNSSNKIISGKEKERVAIALIKTQIAEIVEHEKKLKILQENAAPGKVRADLNLKLAETRFDLKEMQKELVLMEANEKKLIEPVISLKSQLRKAKEELASFEQGTDAFNEAAKKAGNLQDQISDAGDATAAFAKDSKTATAGTLFSQISSDIASLDFKGAADKAKQFALVMSSITFKETLEGVKSLGSAFFNIAKSLLLNPFVLVASAIAAIGIAAYSVGKSFYELNIQTVTVTESLAAGRAAIQEYADRFVEAQIKIKQSLGQITDAQAESQRENLKNNKELRDKSKEHSEAIIALAKELDVDLRSLDEQGNATRNTKNGLSRLFEVNQLKKFNSQKAIIDQDFYKQTLSLVSAQLLNKKAIEIEENKKINEATKKVSDDNSEKLKAQRDKDAAELLQHKKDLAQALIDLAKSANDAEISGLFGREKLEAQKVQADKEIELLKKTIIEKQILAGEGNKLSLESQEQFEILSLRNSTLFAEGLLQIEIEASKLNAEQQKKATDTRLHNFELQERAAIAAVTLLRNPGGMSDEDFEKIKQRKILEVQKEGLEKRIELEIASFEISQLNKISADEDELRTLEGKNDTISFIRTQALNTEIASIKSETPIIVGVMNAENDVKIKAITDNIEKNAKELKPDLLNFDKLLRIPAGTFNKALSDIKSLSDSLFEFQQQQLDGELSIVEKRQDLRDQEIDDLQDKLDEENELRKQGLANNVDGINAEIDAKKAAGLADIELQNKIQAEKKKLAKQQFIIDTALQASTMGLAIAKTFSAYAEVPPVAIAFAALEVAAFVAQRALAFKAINQQQSFADGVIDLQGPGTETSDSIPANLSRRESVMTAKETKANKSLFLGIRKNDNKLIEIGIRDLLKNTGISLDKELPNELSKMKSDIRSNEINVLMPKRDSEHDGRMVSMEKNIAELVKQGNEVNYIDANGNSVRKKGNLTTIIRKK